MENPDECLAVYAPAARVVTVIGDFNFWALGDEHLLNVRWDSSGIWGRIHPGLKQGDKYKYRIFSNHDGIVTEKLILMLDIVKHHRILLPIVWPVVHAGNDAAWISNRRRFSNWINPCRYVKCTWVHGADHGMKIVPFTYQARYRSVSALCQRDGFYSCGILTGDGTSPTHRVGIYQITGFFTYQPIWDCLMNFMQLVDAFLVSSSIGSVSFPRRCPWLE